MFFPRIQGCGHGPSAALGGNVPVAAVCADVLLQLLVGFIRADHCAFVELRELRPVVASQRLLADIVALDVDCRAGDLFLAAARVSAGLLSLVLREVEA